MAVLPANNDLTLWRSVVQQMSDGVAMVDPAGVQLFVNQAFCQMLGCTEQELVGQRTPFWYWPEEHRDAITRGFEGALAGDRRDLELILRRKDGQRFPVLVHPSVILSDGAPICAVATIKDITNLKQLEDSLRHSEQRWRSMAENPFDFVVTLDLAYRYTFVNHTAPGIRAEDLLGKATPFDFIDPKHHDLVRATLERVQNEGRSDSYEIFVPVLRRWFGTIVGPLLDRDRVVGFSMLTRDVTSQKEAEQALRQTQRMEALGRLAGGIAHDFNNLLVPILGNAQLSLETPGLSGADRELMLRDILEAARRARELVSRILVFGREQSRELEAVSMQGLVGEIVRLVKAGAPPSVVIEATLDERCEPVAGIAGELHQVVTNLCSNAIQAVEPTGGTVRIRLEPAELPAAGSANPGEGTRAASPQRAAVRLVVEDTGPGVPEELRARIFDPFFTTRPVGQGTGLGLSIVQAVVARHGGTVSLEGAEGKGACFNVVLPADGSKSGAAAEGGAASSASTRTAVVRGRPIAPQRVVCVDDEILVLRWLAGALTRAGYAPESFSDAVAAEAYLRTHAPSIACVISDESMPELSGTELAARLATFAPQIPVLILSGYLPDRPSPALPNVRARLAKPVDLPELLQALTASRA